MDTSARLAAMPFAGACGIEFIDATPELVRGRLAWAEERCTSAGVLHGGALMTLADTMGAVCAFLNLPAGASTSTIESKTNFFRAVRSGSILAEAKPLHAGRTTIAVRTEVTDDDGRLVAHVVQTQAVLLSR